LTGPMYTINKIISIIQFAREQEEILQVPVLPVFWIAGEDHDFEEVNHIHMPAESGLEKHKINQRSFLKQPLSDTVLEPGSASEWLDTLFEGLNETQFTKSLYQRIRDCMTTSSTYVDFFAK